MKYLKKYLALLLSAALTLGLGAVPALAASADVQYSFEETVLVDNDDVKVTATEFEPDRDGKPTFTMLYENKTDKDLRFAAVDAYLNGRKCGGYGAEEVAAGQQVYSKLYWDKDDMAENGINYIDDVMAEFWIYDNGADIETVFRDMVRWSVNAVSETPSLTDLTFNNGFEEIPVLSGDYTAVIKDFDPDGPWDDGEPSFVVYLENNTEEDIRFSAKNVFINGVECEPYWGSAQPAGTSAYNYFLRWSESTLEEAHIKSLEKVEFDMAVVSPETYEVLTSEPVTVDLTGFEAPAPVEEPAEEPVEEPTEEPAEVPVEEPVEVPMEEPVEEPAEAVAGEFVYEALEEKLTTTDPITLSTGGQSVTISLPTECVLYDEFSQSSNVDAMMVHVLDYGSGRTGLHLVDESDPEKYVTDKIEYWQGIAADMEEENIQATDAVTETINGMSVTWAKTTYETTNVFGSRVQSVDYCAATKAGHFLLTAEVEYTYQMDNGSAIDDSVVTTIFDHVTVAGAEASAETAAGAEGEQEMTVLGSSGGAFLAMTGFENPEGHNATMGLYAENETDKNITFTLDDVTVNGVPYDPFWATSLAPGASEESNADWSVGFLQFAALSNPDIAAMVIAIDSIEQFETITMTVRAYVTDTEEELFSETVTLDVAQNG